MQRALTAYPLRVIAIILVPLISFVCAIALMPAQAQAAAGSPGVSVTRAATGKLVMKKGSTYKLGAKTTSGKLTYKSSKKKVVTISKKGALKAKKAGRAKITVTAKIGSVKAVKEIRVQVVKPKKYKVVKKITAKASSPSIQVGGTAKVTVSFNPKKASNRNVTFKSSNPSVATVAATGTVTALRPGTVKITAKSCANNKKASVMIMVVARPVGEVQRVKYAGGVQAVSSRDAKVAANGRSATVDSGALGSRPKAGQIVVVADDDLQGTAIKVTSASQNADGTYTVKGAKPAFDEVFADVRVAKEKTFSAGDVTWLADGVQVEDVLDSGTELSTQAADEYVSLAPIEPQNTINPGTLKFVLTSKFFKDKKIGDRITISGTGNLTFVYTPVLEYDLDYSFPSLKRLKLVLHEDNKVTFDGKIEGKIEALIGSIGGVINVYFVVGVDGKVTLAFKESKKNGVDYRPGVSGSPLVHEASASGSLLFAATGKIGIESKAKVGLLGYEAVSLGVEAGGKGRWTPTKHFLSAPYCADAQAWVYAEASYKIDKLFSGLSGIDNTGKWEMLNEINSPIMVKSHFENGEPVGSCTWTGDESEGGGSGGESGGDSGSEGGEGSGETLVQGVSPKDSLESYSWEELKKLADAIALAETESSWLPIVKAYHLTDESGYIKPDSMLNRKQVTLSDGSNGQVRILGFCHDVLASGEGVAGISFMYVDTPFSNRGMNSEYKTIGGWEGSEMRDWLNADFYNSLPDDLKTNIVEVSKLTNNQGGNYDGAGDVSIVTPTVDRVWLPSRAEVFGPLNIDGDEAPERTVIYGAEGSQYKLFAEQRTYADGCCPATFLRSPSLTSSASFLSVRSRACASEGAAYKYDACPAFCL